MSKKRITLGGISEDGFRAEDFSLPVLSDLNAMSWLADGLDQAVTERKGVAVVGAKGTGKSVALRRVMDEFIEVEAEVEAGDANRPRRGLAVLTGPRSENRRAVLDVIWKAVVGMEPMRQRGRKIADEKLLEMLIEEILRQNVAVIVVDEAENLSYEALEVLRDIVSLAETTSKRRFSDETYRAAGVGVLLVGTRKLAPRLRESGEAGHRWLRIQSVSALDPDEAAQVYLDFLPQIQIHVDEIGEEGWLEYVRIHVCMGKPVPIRLIENHVRNYARRMFANDATLNRDEIPFEEEIFEYTLKELHATKIDDLT